jgi:SAM-dependent methyltransferase
MTINKVKDLFGIAFRDYISGNKNENILVDISISETEVLPVEYFFREYDQMPEWEQLVLDECRGKILDVGAGAGSHALHLVKKGFDVTAIDISEGGVEVMKERGISKAFVQDFFTMASGEKYDTILLLMNGTGMAGTIGRIPELLKKAASILAPGGSLYLESTDILYMFEDEDGAAMIDLAGNYYGEVTYRLQYKNQEGEPFDWLFVDFDNLSDCAAQAGLDCEVFYSGENSNYVARLSHIKPIVK